VLASRTAPSALLRDERVPSKGIAAVPHS